MEESQTKSISAHTRALRSGRAFVLCVSLCLGVLDSFAPAPVSSPDQLEAEPPRPTAPVRSPRDPAMFDANYKDFRERWIDVGEQEYVRRLLRRHGGNVAAAAREAGVDRTYVYRLIRKHDL